MDSLPGFVQLARDLRSRATDAELLLWSRLRARALGVKFRRQVPVGSAIVDFYCHERALIVEVDGAQHLEPAAVVADADRTRQLEAAGLTVIRFTDREVLVSIDQVVQAIADVVDGFQPSPQPSQRGGEESAARARWATTTPSPPGRGRG